MRRMLILGAALCASACVSACATVNGIPQTPCQRAERSATLAHDAVRLAVDAGANAVVIGKLNTAADAADAVAVGICAAHPDPVVPVGPSSH